MCQVSLSYTRDIFVVPNLGIARDPAKRKTAIDVASKRGATTNLKYNQMMPRLPGCLFKFIQKQPPEAFVLLARKLKRCSQKFLTKFTSKTPVLVSFLKSIKKETLAQLFSCEFCEISKNIFFTEHLLQSQRLLLLFISLSLTFLSSLCNSQLASYRYLILTASVLQLSYFL